MEKQSKKEQEISKVVDFLNNHQLNYAKGLLDFLAKQDLDDLQISFLYGIYYCKKENYRSAISYLLKVLDSTSSTIYLPQAIKVLVLCYIKTENYDLALAIIQDSMDKFYDDLYLKNMQAYIYYVKEDFRTCLKLYRDILQKDPENSTALNGMGYCLIEHFARYTEGLEFCLKALEKNPHDPVVLDSVGWGYFKKGEYQKAEEYLKKAFEILPDNEILKKHLTLAVEAG